MHGSKFSSRRWKNFQGADFSLYIARTVSSKALGTPVADYVLTQADPFQCSVKRTKASWGPSISYRYILTSLWHLLCQAHKLIKTMNRGQWAQMTHCVNASNAAHSPSWPKGLRHTTSGCCGRQRKNVPAGIQQRKTRGEIPTRCPTWVDSGNIMASWVLSPWQKPSLSSEQLKT